MKTIFSASAIDNSVTVYVHVILGKAMATVEVKDGGCAMVYERHELARECRTWAFSGEPYLQSTLLAALEAMALHGYGAR